MPAKTVGHVAAFDLAAPQDDGEYVRFPDSLLFRVGNYTKKNFDMSSAELAAAVDAFAEPVPNELEHFSTAGTPTILDGNLGHVESVRLSDDGTELRGTVAIPRWLDRVWKGPRKQVSAVWDRGTKTLKRLGLVVKGHVEGAALFGDEDTAILAAFSEAYPDMRPDPDRTHAGQMALQVIHDRASEAGAACVPPEMAGFSAPRELAAIQSVHDAAAAGGAQCRFLNKGQVSYFADFADSVATFTPRKTTPEDTAKWQAFHDAVVGLHPGSCKATFGDTPKQKKGFKKAHDLSVEHGAKCGPAAMSAETTHPCGCHAAGSKTMSAKVKYLARLGDRADGLPDVTEEQAAAFNAIFDDLAKTAVAEPPAKDDAAAFAETPYAKAMREELDDLKAARLADARAARAKDAKQFAKDRVISGHLVPANAALFAELVERAMEDDAATPAVVTFSHAGAAKQGGRTEALLALIAAQPKGLHDSPVLGAIQDGTLADRFALFTAADKPAKSDGTSPDEQDALLSHYSNGSAIVADRRKARAGA